MLQAVAQEWRSFRDDRPGQRFEHQQQRARQGSRTALVLRVVVGTLLVVGGGVLLFVPGPGLLVIVFGAALLASVSAHLARLLDRAEPPVRAAGRRARAMWRAASTPARVAMVGGAAVLAAAAAYLAWRWMMG